VLYSNSFKIGLAKSYHKDIIYRGKKDIVSLRTRWQFGIFMIAGRKLNLGFNTEIPPDTFNSFFSLFSGMYKSLVTY